MEQGSVFLIYLAVCVSSLATLTRSLCPEEYSRVDAVQGNILLPKWPMTSPETEVTSEPLCLSEDLNVITRKCSEVWHPNFAPFCSHTSPKNFTFYCPPGYHAVIGGNDYVCVTLSNAKWSNTCRFSTTAFDVDEEVLRAIIQHLKNRGVHIVWLPVRRLKNFGPLLWMIPGSKWRSRFEMTEGIEITYGNRTKDCLAFDVSEGIKIKAEACNAIHPYLCVVEKDYFPRGACLPRYVASPIPSDNRCFRLWKSARNMTWKDANQKCVTAHINSPLIAQLFTAMARKSRLSDDSFCWIAGDGKYKSNTMAFNSKGNPMNLNSTTILHCTFCEIDTPKHPETTISLRFNPEQQQLLLSVYGEEGLWKESDSEPGIRCFTNVNGDFHRTVGLRKIWDKRWTTKDIEPDIDFESRVDLRFDTHKTIYHVEISDKGPGLYVCEGHGIHGELVESKHVIAYKELDGYIFALALDIMDACKDVEHCDPSFLHSSEKLANYLEKATPDHLIKDIRTMEIMDITPDGTVTVLFHVTVENDDDDDDDEPHHSSLPDSYMRVVKVFKLLAASFPKMYRFRFLRPCDGCTPAETGEGDHRLIWPFTAVGMNAVPEEVCLDSTRFPVYRRCNGSYMYGGTWDEPSGECVSDIAPRTKELYEIMKNIRTHGTYYNREVADSVLQIVQNADELTAADIYFLSVITAHETKIAKRNLPVLEDVSRIAYILDKVMRTDQKILERSQILNSTDILLDCLSTILDFVSVNISSESLSEENGLIRIVTSQLIIQISDPNFTDITGVALLRNSTNTGQSNSFLDSTIVPLYADQVIDDVVELGDVDVATWLPRNILNCMLVSNTTSCNASWENVTGSPRVITTLFYSDFVFNSEFAGKRNFVDSRVVSVSVPGYGSYLPIPIPLLFKPLKGTIDETKACAFWDFDYVGVSPTASYSSWSGDGCENAGRTRDMSGELNVCLCSHLTHFAELVLGPIPGPEMEGNVDNSVQHSETLELISVIGCLLSLMGIIGILLTASLFKSWRNKPGTKILIQLSLALGLEKFTIGILPFVDSVSYPIPCVIVGTILHYSVLAEFLWMLVTAWLQFKRYVTVLGAVRPPKFLLKSAVFAWGAPLVIVVTVVSIDYGIYLPPSDTDRRFCQVSGLAQQVSLMAPVAIVVTLNVILFVRVIYSIFRTTKAVHHIENETSLVIAQVRLGVMLFFLLGITWVFGLLAKMGAGLIFSYLFCITAAMQGFVLFLFFIVCDPVTRKLWYSIIVLGGKFSKKMSPTVSASSGVSDSNH